VIRNLVDTVICADSRKFLKKIPSNSITLAYLDPPFFSKRNYEVITCDGKAKSFDDRWIGGLPDYLSFMKIILNECKRVLSDKGSLYLHCDWHGSHYLKVELDKIFGYDNFRNEIVWRRHNTHNDSRQGSKIFGRVHDVILFYSKTRDYVWNPIFAPYSTQFVDKYYRHIEPETGRRYAYGDLTGPGGRSKGNPKYKFLGVTKYWRYSKHNMKKLYSEGRIIQTKKGNTPVLKRYLDEMPGIMLQDVWDDIKSPQVSKAEHVHYPTQKPKKLLERIIEISSNPKDIVLDPFCGSGTTLLCSKSLNRNYVGIDVNPSACEISRTRLSLSSEYELELKTIFKK